MFPLFRLEGRKTYIVAICMAILAFAKAMGWIDENTYQTVLGMLAAAGLGTLRAGVKKCE